MELEKIQQILKTLEYQQEYLKYNIDNLKLLLNKSIDTTGLSDEELEEIKKQIEFMKWKKQQDNNK